MTTACRDGYYGEMCALKCRPGCKSCSNPYYCNTCPEGHYGHHCLKCFSTCKSCVSAHVCTECKDGFYGHLCSTPCPGNCVCLGSICLRCKDGHYITNTQCRGQCHAHCKSCDSQYACSSCPEGHYGRQCEHTCNAPNCSLCYFPDQCLKCKDGMWGPNCNEECSPGCIGNCKVNGHCECKMNYVGEKCDECASGYHWTNNGCASCGTSC